VSVFVAETLWQREEGDEEEGGSNLPCPLSDIGRHRDRRSPLCLRAPVLVSSWVLSGQGSVDAIGWCTH